MPKKLVDCVKHVMASGKPKSSAWPICVASTGLKPESKGGGGHHPKKSKRKSF